MSNVYPSSSNHYLNPHSPDGRAATGDEEAGLLDTLVDVDLYRPFSAATLTLVYVVAALVLGLGLLGSLVVGFSLSVGVGLLVLVVGPVVTLIQLALIRMILQVYRATVR